LNCRRKKIGPQAILTLKIKPQRSVRSNHLFNFQLKNILAAPSYPAGILRLAGKQRTENPKLLLE
jgi:hypothetical protein